MQGRCGDGWARPVSADGSGDEEHWMGLLWRGARETRTLH